MAFLPMMGAMVLHWVGISLARCNNFSSSSRLHSVFLMLGSSHSNHRDLHCLADFLWRREAIRDHWFFPYFMTAALRISSSVFLHTPPLIIIRGILDASETKERLRSIMEYWRRTTTYRYQQLNFNIKRVGPNVYMYLQCRLFSMCIHKFRESIFRSYEKAQLLQVGSITCNSTYAMWNKETKIRWISSLRVLCTDI